MKNNLNINYYCSIKSLLSPGKFNSIKKQLSNVSNDRLEAFWNIIIAGYPVEFALSNYNQLYKYLKYKSIDYTDALTTYSIFPGLKHGIYITKTKWFELN